jgi:hypothetical protein
MTMGVYTCRHLLNYHSRDYHPKTRSENCPSILFDGVPGVPTAAGNTAGCGPAGVLVAVLGVCPGFRNADAGGASRIGVPTVGVCGERAAGRES